MQSIGPELKRAIARGILRTTLEREPTALELSAALKAALHESDPGRFVEAVMRHTPRQTPPVLLELARSAVMMEAELAAIRGSLSWRMAGMMRAAGRKLPLSARLALRDAVIRLYRGTRAGTRLVRSSSAALPALLGRTTTFKAATLPEVPPIDRTLAEANAARWCTIDNPVVSIIIINWNAVELTAHSVRHLWQVTTGTPYEILIADNGSARSEVARLHELKPGVRVLDLGINRFFGEANNIAAEKAAGEFLCFVNNDAFPRPGWIDPLLEALRIDATVGAAGPKFLFPDGRLQEAGAVVDGKGYSIRFGRLLNAAPEDFNQPRDVDYISAATLMMPRLLFEAVGGFDLAFEPAYYEDADLCFRLRLLGRTVRYCPRSEVMHIEGLRTDDRARAAYRKALADFNRGKFVARWDEYLRLRTSEALERLRPTLLPHREFPGREQRAVQGRLASGGPSAEVFSPYALTPGGGERYMLTMAAVLSRSHAVTIVTPFPYSQLRLATLGREFGLDVSGCRMATYEEVVAGPAPDLWVAMGNHIVPSVPARGRTNWYMCQFPFPIDAASFARERGNLAGYQLMLVNSRYTSKHVERAFSQSGVASMPVRILYPPVPMLRADAACKKRMVLSVGRFFAGGHTKRHDVLIEAFRALIARSDNGIELHLAGSSSPLQANMDYLAQLQVMAADLPVTFHLNPPPEKLCSLYKDAAVYWHATGYGAPPEDGGERAEHFGISIVEAMSASCVPIAFAAGGPCEIIEEGVTGFLFDSIDVLLEKTLVMLRPEGEDRRVAIALAAAEAASRYSVEVFTREVENGALAVRALDEVAVKP